MVCVVLIPTEPLKVEVPSAHHLFLDLQPDVLIDVHPRCVHVRADVLHLLVGLPEEWVTGRDENGHIVAVRDTIVAGFVRDEVFYTREEAAVLS